MSMSKKSTHIVPKPIEDYGGIFLYEEVESLAATNFAGTTEASLARADHHGSTIATLVKSEFESQEVQDTIISIQSFLKRASTVLESMSPQELKDWALLLTRLIKFEKTIQLLDIWFSHEVARGNVPQSFYLTLQQIDKVKLAELLPAVARSYIESAPLTFWQEVLDSLKAAANEALTTSLNSAIVELTPVDEGSKMYAWYIDKSIKELSTSDTNAEARLRSMLSPENKAAVEDRKAIRGWGGDRNKAFEILDGALKPKLETALKVKGWHIPGARYEGRDTWEKPSNDEPQLLQMGEFNGLEWARKQDLSELLSKGATSELRNTLIKIATNTLFGGIRIQNRRLGIKVPPDWSSEGKTEDEIREQVDQDIQALSRLEVPDYEIQTEDGRVSTLEQAADKQAFREWAELQVEEAAALKAEKIQELSQKVKLTPRLRLVAQLYDKPNKLIAGKLERQFGKPFTVGAVRALKHDLLVKFKEVSKKK